MNDQSICRFEACEKLLFSFW